jgi:hypothetical protein
LRFFGAEEDKLFQYQMRRNKNARKLLESARNHLNDLRRKKRPLIVGDIDLSPAPTIDQVVPSIVDEILERGEQMGTKERRRFSSASALAAGRGHWEQQRKARDRRLA